MGSSLIWAALTGTSFSSSTTPEQSAESAARSAGGARMPKEARTAATRRRDTIRHALPVQRIGPRLSYETLRRISSFVGCKDEPSEALFTWAELRPLSAARRWSSNQAL